jgi:hypothetical protein
MRHEIANPNRLVEAVIRNSQFGSQVIVDGIVERQLASLDQAHSGDIGESLGDRSDAEQRLVGIDAAAGFEVGEAVTLG